MLREFALTMMTVMLGTYVSRANVKNVAILLIIPMNIAMNIITDEGSSYPTLSQKSKKMFENLIFCRFEKLVHLAKNSKMSQKC